MTTTPPGNAAPNGAIGVPPPPLPLPLLPVLAVSSLTMVPTPVPVPMPAPVALTRFREKVSLLSTVVSPTTVTLTVADVWPGAKVTVPVAAR